MTAATVAALLLGLAATLGAEGGAPWRRVGEKAFASRVRGGSTNMAFQQQYWLPLESSPEVFNDFARRVGVGDGWAFTDVLGLDDELLQLVPQPCIAVVLLFPVNDVLASSEVERRRQLARRPPRVSPRVFFMRQYIGNACGTVAAVHALVNNRERLSMSDGPLSSMVGEPAAPESPDAADSDASCGTPDPTDSASALGEKLSQSEDLMRASETSAQIGQTATPERGVDADYHYVCFVERDGELYELDGTKQQPVNHGAVKRGLLHDASRVIREHFVSKMPDGHFNVMALVADEDGSVAAAAHD